MNIDKQKIVEYLKSLVSPALTDKNIITAEIVSNTLDKINSGEFDNNTESLKSDWKPKIGEWYYMPIQTKNWDGKIYCLAFQTKESCAKYMNAKGWYDDNPWEV